MFFKEALDLTKPRERIYVKHVTGRFQRLRWTAFSVLLAIFLVLPWIDWDGRQAVWLDLPARKFHFFGLTVWPHEMYLLAGLLWIAAFSLFFFTTLAGRLWCGYACPQTVYVSVFLEIERLVEGDRPKQMRLAAEGFTPRRIAKGALKHALFLAVALVVGFTSVAYFVPARDLAVQIARGELGFSAWFWLGLVTLSLYLDGAFFREQVCIYPCPYGRFQGVMTDGLSLVVGYDATRGEPRRGARIEFLDASATGGGNAPALAPAGGPGGGPRGGQAHVGESGAASQGGAAKAQTAEQAPGQASAQAVALTAGRAAGQTGAQAVAQAAGRIAATGTSQVPAVDLRTLQGDCVDCRLCVQVCPQGIDIRDGLQGECIGCARCIDACDMVMTRIGKPKGLIRYDVASAFGHADRPVVRPKLVSYGVLALVVAGAVATYLVNRPDTRLDVTRAPGLYRVLPDGSIANLYTVRPLNLSARPRKYRVRVAGVPGAALRGPDTIAVEPESQVPVSLAVVAPGGSVHDSRRVDFSLEEEGRVVARRPSNFLAP